MKQQIITRDSISVQYLDEYKMFKFTNTSHNVKELCKRYNVDYYHINSPNGIITSLQDISYTIQDDEFDRLINTGFSLEDCWYIKMDDILNEYIVNVRQSHKSTIRSA